MSIIMKVLLVNGSPRAKGCTYTALMEAAKTFEKEGIEWELFQVGMKPVAGCLGCGRCGEIGKCVIDDNVNEFVEKISGADGFIFGTPVHYAAASGALTSFMDRVFISANKKDLYLKPAACITSARRAGTTAAFEQINKYFTISQMPVISSTYWNMVHGSKPEDVLKDEEGLQCIRTLARNMSWFLRIKAAGAEAGVPFPETEKPIKTNFIR